jgi:hypothetical protein
MQLNCWLIHRYGSICGSKRCITELYCIYIHTYIDTALYTDAAKMHYCHSHNNWGPRNSFQPLLVPVYYWKTVENSETDPQLLWEWQYVLLPSICARAHSLYTYIHTHTHTYIYIYITTYLYTHIYTYMNAYNRRSRAINVCTRSLFIHIHTHTHTYIYI